MSNMPEFIPVTLSLYELKAAAEFGVMRQIANLKKGRKPAHGSEEKNPFEMHITGCAGEMVLAKWLGVYWMGNHGRLDLDVGQYEVRARSEGWHDMIIYPSDIEEKPDKPFVLITGRCQKWVIRGWRTAAECKRDEWWKDGTGPTRAGYFVPQRELHDVRSLPA